MRVQEKTKNSALLENENKNVEVIMEKDDNPEGYSKLDNVMAELDTMQVGSRQIS